MSNAHTTTRGRRRPRRARLLIAGLVLAGAASVAPTGTTAPAGAFGSASIGCGASGYSGLWGSDAVATTTGSTCGSNQVRWNSYWGPDPTWKKVAGSASTIVESPHLYAGGGGHRACDSCIIVNT